jgi:hypothetical protein
VSYLQHLSSPTIYSYFLVKYIKCMTMWNMYVSLTSIVYVFTPGSMSVQWLSETYRTARVYPVSHGKTKQLCLDTEQLCSWQFLWMIFRLTHLLWLTIAANRRTSSKCCCCSVLHWMKITMDSSLVQNVYIATVVSSAGGDMYKHSTWVRALHCSDSEALWGTPVG